MKRYLSILLSLLMILSTVPVFGAATLLPNPNPQFFSNTNVPCSGCKLYFYENNTSTLKDTYISSAMTTTNANPVVLNSRGEAASGIWLDGTYSVTLKTSAGSTIWGPKHDIRGVADISAIEESTLRWLPSEVTPSFVSTTQFSVSGDYTGIFPVGRRLQITETAGTVYGRITASSYALSVTTVTVALDSGTLDSGISAVNYSLESPTNTSISADMISSGALAADLTSTGTVTVSGNIISNSTATWSGTYNVTGNISSSGTNTMTGRTVISGTGSWIESADSLLMTGEAYSTGVVSQTADMGTATAGDRIAFHATCSRTFAAAGAYTISVTKSAGTATISPYNGTAAIYNSLAGVTTISVPISGMILVTVGGTISLNVDCTGGSGYSAVQIYAVYLKKQ